jgi:hypothetical protein
MRPKGLPSQSDEGPKFQSRENAKYRRSSEAVFIERRLDALLGAAALKIRTKIASIPPLCLICVLKSTS